MIKFNCIISINSFLFWVDIVRFIRLVLSILYYLKWYKNGIMLKVIYVLIFFKNLLIDKMIKMIFLSEIGYFKIKLVLYEFFCYWKFRLRIK